MAQRRIAFDCAADIRFERAASKLNALKSPGVLTIVPTFRSFRSTSSDEMDLGSRYASGIGITFWEEHEGRQVVVVIMRLQQSVDRWDHGLRNGASFRCRAREQC